MSFSKMELAGVQPPDVSFSFRIGLWPIGLRRLMAEDEPSESLEK
jgi:hypothetical protein